MMAITTSSSTRVKPERFEGCMCGELNLDMNDSCTTATPLASGFDVDVLPRDPTPISGYRKCNVSKPYHYPLDRSRVEACDAREISFEV